MKLFTLCAGLLAGLFSLPAQAQGVTIGAPGAPDASATLEVRSTVGGLLLPRLTSAQRVVIAAPAAGLLVFQTDNTPGVYYYDGTFWRNLTTGRIPATTGVATTLAGSTPGSADGSATTAQFNTPYGVACDGSGNVYVADTFNNCIRCIVAATGAVSTLAGSATPGSANGLGAAAQFNGPRGVACSADGHVYVADTNNSLIRDIVVTTGAVTTLAGSTTPGFINGTSAAAQFRQPTGVACIGTGANGIVYVADTNNHSIRLIQNGTVSTLAGTSGMAGFADGSGAVVQFNNPTGVAIDGTGNVYVADTNNGRIRRILTGFGYVYTLTLAGSATQGNADGTGPAAQFNNPTGVAIDGTGNVYVADAGNNRIRRIAASGVVSTLAGSTQGNTNGTGPAAQFNRPSGVAIDAGGNLFVADTDNSRIRLVK